MAGYSEFVQFSLPVALQSFLATIPKYFSYHLSVYTVYGLMYYTIILAYSLLFHHQPTHSLHCTRFSALNSEILFTVSDYY